MGGEEEDDTRRPRTVDTTEVDNNDLPGINSYYERPEI